MASSTRNKRSMDEQAKVKVGAAAIPGPAPKDDQTGNLAEIGAARSFHHFMLAQHMRHGPVVGIWMGKQYVVSVASPGGFKRLVNVFDLFNRPPALFRLFLPLVTEKSIQYANYEDGRARRQMYDRAFSHSAINKHYTAFQQVSDEIVVKWSSAGRTDHLPVHRTMLDVAIKALVLSIFGEYFRDERPLAKLQDSFVVCWEIAEQAQSHGFPEAGSERHQQFKTSLESVHAVLKEVMAQRRSVHRGVDDKILIDYLMELDESEDRIISDALSYIIGGYSTVGNCLTWALYYLARDQTAQEKLAHEIKTVLGDRTVNETNISQLKYLGQVQKETLRCSVLVPWNAKFLDEDIELEGYIIPAKTPIITEAGVMLQDPSLWPDPERFDPERFNPENIKKLPADAFSPFGPAGKRMCPGHRFAYSETAVVLATLLRKFRLQLVKKGDVKGNFGIVTSVAEEVWVSLTPR